MATRFHHRLVVALRSFFRRRTVEDELDEELRFHLRQLEAHEAARGPDAESVDGSPRRSAHRRDESDDTAWRARRDFGGVDQVKEACRDMRTLRSLEHLIQDLRFGGRLLVRNPVFAIVASLSLALGIGANSVVFAAINGILFRSLPVSEAGQLYIAEIARKSDEQPRFAYPTFENARAVIGSRAELAAASTIQPMQIGMVGSATKALKDGTYVSQSGRVQLVSGEYFGLLRQRAQIGRLLGPEDNRTLAQRPVAVISNAYWTRRFDRAHNAVGSELTVNGVPLTVVGVAAPGFFGTTVGSSHADLWVPIMMQSQVRYAGRMTTIDGDARQPWPPQPGVLWLDILLRIPSGNVGAITEAFNLAAQRGLAGESPSPPGTDLRERAPAARFKLTPAAGGISEIRGAVMAPLLVLLAMVVLLLAITCANVASLLLARATSRHREMAIRLSIGAGRGRLIRQLLTESLLLAALGGGMGLLVAYWGIGLGQSSAWAIGIDVSPDWRVTGITMGTSLVAGLVFGLLPALRSTDRPLVNSLKSQTCLGLGAGGRLGPARMLVAGQIAFSVVLLIVAALFARSLQELTRVEVGFDRDHLIVARVDAGAGGYMESEVPALCRRVLERITAIPGVTAASMSTTPPFSGSRVRSGFEIEGYRRRVDEQLSAHEERVTADYFRTVGLKVVQGRTFGLDDRESGGRVSVINQTMAKRYFPNQNPVGRRWGPDADFRTHGYEIVGVVQDAHYNDLKSAPPNMVYLPAAGGDDFLNGIEIRASGEPGALVDTIRAVLREVEPRLPLTFIKTLDEQIRQTISPERLLTLLTMGFSGVALFLACLGLYGTMSYAVTRRTAELGLRMAIGASGASVRWLVMREALAVLVLGLLAGVPLAFLSAHAMRNLLHGITPGDVQAHTIAVSTLVIVVASAAYLPARRAARVDPISALRAE
jgi:predicted permease